MTGSMKQRKPEDNRTTFQTMALVTQLGFMMIVSIGMPSILGVWLDRKFGTAWITILMFVIGAIAGVQSVYRMIQKIYGDGGQKKERDSSGENHRSVKKD